MATLTEIDQGRLSSLATYSMEKFCEGYRMMFGQAFKMKLGGFEIVEVSELKGRCGQFIAINSVSCVGDAEGRFLVVLDQKAMFTLGGATVMFPKPRIMELREKGTDADIEFIEDAIREVGNLIVGEFAIGLRAGCPSAEGFGDNEYIKLDLPVPIGDVVPEFPEGGGECTLLTYEMEIADYGPFNVYVAFPLAE